MKQLRLEGIDPPDQVQATAARPVVWIESLEVLSRLSSEPENVVRAIALRRGLNVVWAPPRPAKGTPRLFQDGLPGHTAGKTMFARLVRYVLGEPQFAAEGIRDLIRQQFGKGWVIGRVHVREEGWFVARPFEIGAHPFAVRSTKRTDLFDRAKRVSFDDYLAALDIAVVGTVAVSKFADGKTDLSWLHVLPWLTRDQECAFAAALEWRHPSSGSELPALTVQRRSHVVRAVLGLVSEAERKEQSKNARLLAKRRRAVQHEPLVRHQAGVDLKRLASALEVDSIEDSELGLASTRQRLSSRLDEVEQRLDAIKQSQQRKAAQKKLDEAIAEQARLDERNELARRNLQAAIARRDQTMMSEKAQSMFEGALGSLPPSDKYCRVPLSTAIEQGCPLAAPVPVSLGQHRAERMLDDEVSRLSVEVAKHQELVAASARRVEAAKQNTTKVRRAYLRVQTKQLETWGELRDERAELRRCRRLVDEAIEARRDLRQTNTSIEKLGKRIEQSREKQQALRMQRARAVGELSRRFDYVVRAFLGDEVNAELTDGRVIDLSIRLRGERQSAALAVIKTLALDLAALTHAVEGKAHFPLFLLHDGPRAADVADDVYARLFHYVLLLEDCFEEEPAFQYIVTTTTKPPTHVRKKPWLRLKLGGGSPEERLLGVDL